MRSKRGFSLIAVLVAAALIGILSLVFTSMFKHSNEMQKHVERGTEFSTVLNSLNLVLADPASCSQALIKNNAAIQVTLPVPLGTVIDLDSVNFASAPIIKKDEKLLSGIIIKSIKLEFPTAGTAATVADPLNPGTNVPTTRFLTNFSATGEKPPQINGPRIAYNTPAMPVALYVDATGKVVSCSSHSTVTADFPDIDCEVEGTFLFSYIDGEKDCRPVDAEQGSKKLSFSQPAAPGDMPVSCEYTYGASTRSYNCSAKGFSCTYLNAADALAKGSGAGSGWYYIKDGNGKLVRSCSQGVTTTDSSKEVIVGVEEALPSGVSADTHTTNCRIDGSAKGEVACDSMVTDLTDAAGNPAYTNINQPFAAAPQPVIGLCYRKVVNGKNLWFYVKNVNTKKGKVSKEQQCVAGVRSVTD
ncbi:MAG TPA: type II secretion system protein [Bdellovibrionota bacterium]|jgi:hypothetical protein|nr:type II secretion system protein [Bdellovibrionota bacterium]